MSEAPGLTLADPVTQAAKTAKKSHWSVRELVSIGVLATVIKASTIMVAYMGGGINPVTLALKNCLYVTLMIVLMHKVPKTGTMTLTVGITALISLLLMGQSILRVHTTIIAYLLGEALVFILGGYRKTRNIVIGVIAAEVISKLFSLGIVGLMMREQPAMLITVSIFVFIGTLGTFIGGFAGVRFIKELRHAGIIFN